LGRKWNKMSETLKQKFNKSKPEAAEPDTKPTDIQPEKEPVVQIQPNIEPQVKSDTEEETRLSKPEVPTAGPEITPESSEISELSDLIGRSNVGSTIKLPSDEAAKNDIKSPEEVSEEPVAEEIITDDVISDTAEETEVEEAAPDEAVVEQDAAEENADQEAVAEEASVEETASADEAVAEEDVAEEVIINAQEGIIAEQNVTEVSANDENEIIKEAAEEATEEAAEETTEAIIHLNEVKSDGNQQIKSELQDQIDITENEAAEVAVDSAQGEGIPATD
jgi:hypothetical protein